MPKTQTRDDLAEDINTYVREDFSPRFGELEEQFANHATWSRLRELGTRLWLDTGNIEQADELWTREFSALTTNNTLLNREVQTGHYDDTIQEAADLLEPYDLSEDRLILEIAFVLNARHGLRLVEKFDAHVSVEEHTDLAHDLEGAIDYARRYHAICPERFIVKIPFTPSGLLATRVLSEEGIPINHTLGFSARQNYVIARVGRPDYVNVFLGRLNSFVADNDLGDGRYVGERAVLASQSVVRQLRSTHDVPSRQIGASYREGTQVRDLAGLDVMTMPPSVAQGFLDLNLPEEKLEDRTGEDYRPPLNHGVDPQEVRLDTLWDVEPDLVECVDELEQRNLKSFSPEDLVDFFHQHGCGDVFPRWSSSDIETSAEEGKIPRLENWQGVLERKEIGLDSLMNLAGLNSFVADQDAMDKRVSTVLRSS